MSPSHVKLQAPGTACARHRAQHSARRTTHSTLHAAPRTALCTAAHRTARSQAAPRTALSSALRTAHSTRARRTTHSPLHGCTPHSTAHLARRTSHAGESLSATALFLRKVRHLPPEPRPGELPVPLDRASRRPDHRSGFFHRQPAEEPEFDDAGLPGIQRAEAV